MIKKKLFSATKIFEEKENQEKKSDIINIILKYTQKLKY